MKILKKMKNQLDERQEEELLHIEKTGFWIAYWSLFAAIMIELFLGFSRKQMAAEFIILMIMSVYTLIACIKKGIWDRHLKPNIITNLCISFLGGFAVGIFSFIQAYRYYGLSLTGDFVNFVVNFISTFLLTFVVLQVVAFFYKKQKQKLEKASLDDFDK